MTIFLDTAKIDEIEKAVDLGVVHGVTTNPNIFKESGLKYSKEVYFSSILDICDLVRGPVSVELTNSKGSIDELVREACELSDIDGDYVVIKVPMWGDGKGLSVIKELTEKGIPTNATCLMSPSQAILAMEAGARYVSLFFNRILDWNNKELAAVEDAFRLAHIYLLEHGADWEPPAEIIAGSIRSPLDVPLAFSYGADIVTVKYEVLMGMITHPRTESTIKEFDEAWSTFTKEDRLIK
jgi:transaldolase